MSDKNFIRITNFFKNFIIRVLLDNDLEIKNELVLIDSSELSVIVNRNLQVDMFRDIVPIDILASYNGLSVFLLNLYGKILKLL